MSVPLPARSFASPARIVEAALVLTVCNSLPPLILGAEKTIRNCDPSVAIRGEEATGAMGMAVRGLLAASRVSNVNAVVAPVTPGKPHRMRTVPFDVTVTRGVGRRERNDVIR